MEWKNNHPEKNNDPADRYRAKAEAFFKNDIIAHIVTVNNDWINGYVGRIEDDFLYINRVDNKIPNPARIFWSDIVKFDEFRPYLTKLVINKKGGNHGTA